MLTRDAVIKESLQLGQEVGEEGLTMRALANRLGVSPTSLYEIFEGKNAILNELRLGAWHVLGDSLAPVLGIADRSERLRAMCRTYLDFARTHPWLYSLAMEARPIEELGGEVPERALNPARLALAALRDGAPPGMSEAHLGLSVVDFWASLHGLATLLASGHLAPGQHPALEDLDAFVRRYIDDLIAAL